MILIIQIAAGVFVGGQASGWLSFGINTIRRRRAEREAEAQMHEMLKRRDECDCSNCVKRRAAESKTKQQTIN